MSLSVMLQQLAGGMVVSVEIFVVTLVFSLPVFAAEHWIDVRVPEQYQQEHVQGAINIPLK